MKRKLTLMILLVLIVAILVMPVQAQGHGDGGSGSYLAAVAISFLIAFIVVSILKAGMKNVRCKEEAGNYVSVGLNLTLQKDQYTHTTTSRRKIETSSNVKAGR